MDYNQAKEALLHIFKWGGSGDEKEVKNILDTHPSLLNEVIICVLYGDDNIISHDIVEFKFC